MYCRHREGHSLHVFHTDIAVPSPQKCLLHTDWKTLSVAGQACPAGMEVCICMCGQRYVCECIVCVCGGGTEQGN